jgi:hypothetical protein
MPPRSVLSLFVTAALAVSLAGCGGDDDRADAGAPTPTTAAEQAGWVSITDEPSGARFSLPTRAEPLEDTATVEDGSEVLLRNYSSVALDGVVEVGFNIIDTHGGDYDLDAGVAGVADTLGGEVVSSVDTEVDGRPAVDVEMTYGADKIVLFQLVSAGEHIMQTLASGPTSEREAVEITYRKLNESLEVD